MRVRDQENIKARKEADRVAREQRKRELSTTPTAWRDLPLNDEDHRLCQELMDQSAIAVQGLNKSPAQAQEEINAEYLKRSREVAAVWCASEPAYYKSSTNSEAMTNWLIEHPEHRADNLESFNQAFTELRKQGKLEQRPQPSAEEKARAYHEDSVLHSESRDWSARDLDALSADRYKEVMRGAGISVRMRHSDFLQPRVWQPQPDRQPDQPKPKSILEV